MSDGKSPIEKAKEAFREVGKTSRGYTIFREPNECGGHRYWSDSIGGGVCIWDTCLASEEELLFAMEIERSEALKALEGE